MVSLHTYLHTYSIRFIYLSSILFCQQQFGNTQGIFSKKKIIKSFKNYFARKFLNLIKVCRLMHWYQILEVRLILVNLWYTWLLRNKFLIFRVIMLNFSQIEDLSTQACHDCLNKLSYIYNWIIKNILYVWTYRNTLLANVLLLRWIDSFTNRR